MPVGKVYRNPNYHVVREVDEIHHVITSNDPDVHAHHDRIVRLLLTPSNSQRQHLVREYRTKYGGADLAEELRRTLPPSELATNQFYLSLLDSPSDHDAKHLMKAMKGLGTNEDMLIEILVTRNNYQLRLIKAAYQRLFNRELAKDIAGDTSGMFKALLLDLLEANRDESRRVDMDRAKADAAALYKAGEGKLGTDEAAFVRILCNQNWAQLHAMFNEYEKLGKKHTMEQAIRAEFSGDELNALLAICSFVRNGPIGEVAELLHKCLAHGGKDDMLAHLIISHSELDLQDIEDEYLKRFKMPLEQAIAESGKPSVLKNALIRMIRGNN